MFSHTDTDFNLDRHLISFLQDTPFFAELSRHIRKTPTTDMPTAAVAFDPTYDDITLYWNPEFFRGMTDQEIRGVLTHEFYHLIFRHLTERRKKPAKMWNVATDLAINSIISGHSNMALPKGCLMPGKFPEAPEGREWTAEEKASKPIAQLIAEFPKDQSSEWYFEKLKDKVEEERKKGDNAKGIPHPDGDPFGGLDSFDDHGAWDDLTDEQKEMVASKVSGMVEKATKHADSQANGWGNIPSELREEIRRSVSKLVDWRNVLRQFIGNIARGERTTTIKRINKRYPYIHPGVKRGYVAKLLIAIDQSGSVDDGQLALFFNELASLTKKVSVTILPFDCAADLRDAFEWKKGTNVPAKRVRGGGTDFNAPTKVANDPKNRGKWDGMLIMTDGECSAPAPSRVKRGWVVSPGHKLEFPTNEITINLDPSKPKSGAWR
jgi:predicted metal-dependent peptidase